MQYVISFLEGIITFISPCLLPMLPIYISYFAGGGERSTGKTLAGAVGFVAGFTAVFVTMGAFQLNLFKGSSRFVDTGNMNFFSALLFGVIFSLGWTPCVGAFLGSALMLASQQGHVAEGMLMLLAYSLGLGIPFLLSAVLIDYLKSAFNWIKGHYRVINLVCGVFLVLVGILMATGTLGRLLSLLS